jgi:hypothetical protein
MPLFSLLLAAAGALLLWPAIGAAQAPVGLAGPNDLFALGQGMGQTPSPVPVARRAEPPLVAAARPHCDPGSHPEPDVQGRVPAGTGTGGLWCNLRMLSHHGTSGGFKTLRYVDPHGHECAFYDTALLFPTNAINVAGPSLGVAVLDMSDPAHPVQTDTLTALPMISPHESLNLNVQRGLLAAVNGNPGTYPGIVSIYDVHGDCRHPVLASTSPVARLGHESGFAADGKTFYATATAYQAITAIDVTDPTAPHAIWEGNIFSHGMTLSDDGNRAYIADASARNMLILDTSEIQARRANPQAREISRLTWASASIPQNAIPFTENGKPYVLEFDEYTAATLNAGGSPDAVGAGRIIDTSDETRPRVIANLRLQVDQPAEHRTASGDPGNSDPAQGYAAHYCNLPTRVDPKLVACSFIASGLRLFDISNLTAPKEIGYFVSPTNANTENGYNGSDFAMSQPVFVPARREIWYTDGGSGFYVLRVDPGVWPAGASRAATVRRARCGLGRLTFRLHRTGPGPITSVRVYVGRRLVLTRRGHNLARVSLTVGTRGRQRIRIVTYDRRGRNRTSVRTVQRCAKSPPRTTGRQVHS